MGSGLVIDIHGFCQFSSVAQSCPTFCNPMNCSTPGLPVHHQLPEFTQTHIHRVSDAIKPSHPLSSPSPPALNFSQHQGLFQRVSSSGQVAKVTELQHQHQSFQWIFNVDFLCSNTDISQIFWSRVLKIWTLRSSPIFLVMRNFSLLVQVHTQEKFQYKTV